MFHFFIHPDNSIRFLRIFHLSSMINEVFQSADMAIFRMFVSQAHIISSCKSKYSNIPLFLSTIKLGSNSIFFTIKIFSEFLCSNLISANVRIKFGRIYSFKIECIFKSFFSANKIRCILETINILILQYSNTHMAHVMF